MKLYQWRLQGSYLVARPVREGCPGLQQHLPEAISNPYVELFSLGHKDEPALRHLTYLVQHGLVCGPDPYLPSRGTHGSWGTWGARWAWRTRNTDSLSMRARE